MSTSQGKTYSKEMVQNKALRIITGAAKRMPTAVMQIYNFNPPITIEIKETGIEYIH